MPGCSAHAMLAALTRALKNETFIGFALFILTFTVPIIAGIIALPYTR